ncbi:hypothetical protein PoB_007423400 [Plakobranchus ocellatus]|uniref:Uncharacterized protein n=1 Tax=Plakobranchus ocellatus TaxID=259542 RepID=A0AAV4DUN8_9GAST|nr:hypothetical protein PoB_007423400 [Plakobranchus ocellatus]
MYLVLHYRVTCTVPPWADVACPEDRFETVTKRFSKNQENLHMSGPRRVLAGRHKVPSTIKAIKGPFRYQDNKRFLQLSKPQRVPSDIRTTQGSFNYQSHRGSLQISGRHMVPSTIKATEGPFRYQDDKRLSGTPVRPGRRFSWARTRNRRAPADFRMGHHCATDTPSEKDTEAVEIREDRNKEKQQN